MKGIIFNVVEEAVCAAHGEAAWDALLLSAGLDGGYSALGDYPDAELGALVTAGSQALDVPAEDLLRWLGHESVLLLAERYPQFVTPHHTTRDFLLTLNDVIHPEVRKLHANARPPQFDFEVQPDGGLLVGYHSSRGLCVLADGMIGGVATHFAERASVVHLSCTHRRDQTCRMQCTFAPAVQPVT